MTINEFERQEGIIITSMNDSDVQQKISDSDLETLIAERKDWHFVNWEDREKFLSDNGYELNRHNMADVNLSARKGVSK